MVYTVRRCTDYSDHLPANRNSRTTQKILVLRSSLKCPLTNAFPALHRPRSFQPLSPIWWSPLNCSPCPWPRSNTQSPAQQQQRPAPFLRDGVQSGRSTGAFPSAILLLLFFLASGVTLDSCCIAQPTTEYTSRAQTHSLNACLLIMVHYASFLIHRI